MLMVKPLEQKRAQSQALPKVRHKEQRRARNQQHVKLQRLKLRTRHCINGSEKFSSNRMATPQGSWLPLTREQNISRIRVHIGRRNFAALANEPTLKLNLHLSSKQVQIFPSVLPKHTCRFCMFFSSVQKVSLHLSHLGICPRGYLRI